MNISETIKKIKKSRIVPSEKFIYDILDKCSISIVDDMETYILNNKKLITINHKTKTIFYNSSIINYFYSGKYTYEINDYIRYGRVIINSIRYYFLKYDYEIIPLMMY